MKRTELRLIFASPEAFAEEPIKICGWLRTSRNSKSIGFIELNDGTCFSNIQVVYEEDKVNNFKEINKLNVGSAVSVIGNIILTPDAKQPFEMHATEVIIEGESTPDYPLQKKRHSLEYLRTIARLRPRTNTFSAAFRVRSAAALGSRPPLVATTCCRLFFSLDALICIHSFRKFLPYLSVRQRRVCV